MATRRTNFGRKQQWRNDAIAYLVESLTELGKEACQHAIEERGYNNIKYNLRDSIGSAVYVDGRIVPSSKRYAFTPKSSKGAYKDKGERGQQDGGDNWITGREALDRYWDEHPTLPNAKNAVELVVVAGTFYAGILEDRGIQVISAAADYLEDKMDVYKSFRPKLRGHADLVDIV